MRLQRRLIFRHDGSHPRHPAKAGAPRASTAAGAASVPDNAAATDFAAEPTIQDGVVAAASTASRKAASRGAVNVRPPGLKTCR